MDIITTGRRTANREMGESLGLGLSGGNGLIQLMSVRKVYLRKWVLLPNCYFLLYEEVIITLDAKAGVGGRYMD